MKSGVTGYEFSTRAVGCRCRRGMFTFKLSKSV